MFRQDSRVKAVLAKMETKAKKRGTVQALVIRAEFAGEDQTFLETYEDQCRNSGPIMNLFQGPEVAWKSLQLEAAYVVDVLLDFDSVYDVDRSKCPDAGLKFRANLVGIKVSRTYKNGMERYTYQIQLEKDLDPSVDKDLAHFVNAKMVNQDTLKNEVVRWPWLFEAVEPLAQSVDTETGGADSNEGDFEG